MYTILGGDGKEYGPVPTDQVREWIAAGRANLDTRARELGSEQWKRLGDFPDFGAAGGAFSTAAPASTAAYGTPKQIADELIARAGKLDVMGCYERSWNLLKANFWPFVGITFLLVVAMEAVLIAISRLIPFVGGICGALFAGVFVGGLYFYYLKRIRGQPAGIRDAFSGFGPAFGMLVGAGVLITLLLCAGFVALVLPGIYLMVAYNFTFLLILDKKLGVWTAMEVSRRVITAQWWRLFGLMLLGIPFCILGLVALVVGIFVAMPLIYVALVYAYEDLCNPKGATAPPQPASPAAP